MKSKKDIENFISLIKQEVVGENNKEKEISNIEEKKKYIKSILFDVDSGFKNIDELINVQFEKSIRLNNNTIKKIQLNTLQYLSIERLKIESVNNFKSSIRKIIIDIFIEESRKKIKKGSRNLFNITDREFLFFIEKINSGGKLPEYTKRIIVDFFFLLEGSVKQEELILNALKDYKKDLTFKILTEALMAKNKKAKLRILVEKFSSYSLLNTKEFKEPADDYFNLDEYEKMEWLHQMLDIVIDKNKEIMLNKSFGFTTKNNINEKEYKIIKRAIIFILKDIKKINLTKKEKNFFSKLNNNDNDLLEMKAFIENKYIEVELSNNLIERAVKKRI